jgi:hypothetical protein
MPCRSQSATVPIPMQKQCSCEVFFYSSPSRTGTNGARPAREHSFKISRNSDKISRMPLLLQVPSPKSETIVHFFRCAVKQIFRQTANSACDMLRFALAFEPDRCYMFELL